MQAGIRSDRVKYQGYFSGLTLGAHEDSEPRHLVYTTFFCGHALARL